jgi:hypothetical protein
MIECRYCDIPFDDVSERGEAEYLARVHNALWHFGSSGATVVLDDRPPWSLVYDSEQVAS